MDPWLTIGTALMGGSVGAVVTTLLRISYEREEQLRERMLSAADEFVTAAARARSALNDARDTAVRASWADEEGRRWVVNTETHELLPPIAAAYTHATSLVNDAYGRVARIHLLFGRFTKAGSGAQDIIVYMNQTLAALYGRKVLGVGWEGEPEYNSIDVDRIDDAFGKAVQAEWSFCELASRQIMGAGKRWAWLMRRIGAAKTDGESPHSF